MKRHVRIYIEGGAEGRNADADFRRGWKKFLSDLHQTARAHGYHSLEVVRGKGRRNTFERFQRYHAEFPNDLCVLMVDSETGVPAGILMWDVVARRTGDNWQRPKWATERHLYLMVQFVETWLVTDPEALKAFFKQGFDSTQLPTDKLEERSKGDIEQALKRATRHSRKGEYQHRHATEILATLRPERVRTLSHGERLFDTLDRLIRNVP